MTSLLTIPTTFLLSIFLGNIYPPYGEVMELICPTTLRRKSLKFKTIVCVMNQIPREHKNIRISTPCLANDRKTYSKFL
jgi:hypothetical protein